MIGQTSSETALFLAEEAVNEPKNFLSSIIWVVRQRDDETD